MFIRPSKKILKGATICRLLLYAISSIYVLSVGGILEPDTDTYFSLSVITSPGYPSFLYFFKKIFSQETVAFYVMIVQLGICILSVLFFAKTIKNLFNISAIFVLALEILLLSPLWIPEYLVANRIVSEGLAYPGFLLVLAFFICALLEKDKRWFPLFFVTISVLILIRAQFNFMLPVALIVLGCLMIVKKSSKIYGIPFIAVLIVPIITSVANKSFHYAVSGKYASTSNTGVLMMAMPFYVSDAEDYQVYKDPKVQEYFKKTYHEAEELKVLDDYYQSSFNDNVYAHYHTNFGHISYGILSVQGRMILYPNEYRSDDALIDNNKLLISMWWPLFWDNFKKSMDLFYKNVIHAFGGFYNLYLHFIVLISAIIFWFRTYSKFALFSIVFLLCVFSNILVICMTTHSLSRFLMYTNWMLPLLFIVMLDKVFKNLKFRS